MSDPDPTGKTKIIVLDDDPTGSQTVHGCLLLTRWDADTLRVALDDAAPLFFVLTNTRGMDTAQAADTVRGVCRNLKAVLRDGAMAPFVVSRSDSTLRGHYPLETDILAEELGPFDAHFLVPAFFEGGRVTVDGVHYLVSDGARVPVHETEFARDSVFAYHHSDLPAYVEEKTAGRIKAREVVRFTLADVRAGCLPRLLSLTGNACAVVDAETQADLDRFTGDLRRAMARGKRFLFRSAASLLTSLARLPPQPVAPEDMRRYVRHGAPGAVIVGSHVPRTTRQLERLLGQPGVAPLEVDVRRLPEGRKELLASLTEAARRAHAGGQTPVIYTSREERGFDDPRARLAFGKTVSELLMDVVRALPPTLGYLVSKGGITSNDLLSDGLALRMARLLGQILPGCSVVRCPPDHPRFPDLPVVIFPGNVGGPDALATVYARLGKSQPP
ncbi:MAG: four-carbon acid sugar kinase family protein [Gammaproteobacteria bacterium]|nr:four-carbon acid sugar kinase family protein [Gammaproteobacteria bacterium]